MGSSARRNANARGNHRRFSYVLPMADNAFLQSALMLALVSQRFKQPTVIKQNKLGAVSADSYDCFDNRKLIGML